MDYTNSKTVKRLRIIFLVLGLSWLLAVAILIFFSLFTAAVISAGMFLVAMLVIAILNFQYVRFTVDKEKITVRYYSIFAVDRLFRMFEFPVDQLRKVEVRKYLLGLKLEVRFTIRVRKGLADYPWVSLAATPFHSRAKLINALTELVPKKPNNEIQHI
jgi:hypothetical protein